MIGHEPLYYANFGTQKCHTQKEASKDRAHTCVFEQY